MQKIVSSILSLLATSTLVLAQPKLIQKIEKTDNPYQINYEKYELPNGLTIIVHEDHSDPIVHVDVTYHVGSAREELGKSGFAHFYEHMMFQGSDHVGDEQHFKIVSAAGGTLNGTTNLDRTNYFETLPSNQLEVALWLESDRMGFLLDAVTQKKFEIQRSTVKNERGQNYDNRPYGLVNEKVVKALYPYGHPYNWPTIGYIKDLNNATLADLKQFFLRWYGPNNATLTVAGDIKTEDVIKLAEKYFGNITPCPTVPPVDKSMLPELSQSRYVSYEDNIRQPLVSINFQSVPMNHEDEIALDALAEILSGNKKSIIYKRFIDDQKALTAYCSHPTGEIGGRFNFTALPMPGTSLENIERMFYDIIGELKVNGITEDEVNQFKINREVATLNRIASVSGKASLLASAQTFTGNANHLVDEMNRVKNLRASDVMRVLETYVYKKNAVVLSAYPKGKPTEVAHFDNFELDTTKIYEKAFLADKEKLTYVKAKDTFSRDKQPISGAAPVLEVPKFWKKTFENKMKVIGTYSSETPMITLQLSIAAGHIADPLDKAGLAALTAEMFKESTAKNASETISEALTKLGSTIDVNANATDINFTVSSLVKNIDSTLAIFKEMLFYPLMDADEFVKIKNKQLQAISNQSAQASVIASNNYTKLLYGNAHIFSLPVSGTTETVDKITVEDVRQFTETAISSDVSTLVIAGNMEQETILPKLEFLKNWKPKTPVIISEKTTPIIEKTKIYFINKDKAPQSELRIGNMALPYDAYGEFYNCQLMNFILGGTFNSRINLNLREDKGFTYGARTSFNGSKYRGPFTASTGVRATATDSSVVEIMKEIKKYKTKGITDEELKFTKNSIGLSEALKYETNGQKAGFLKRIVEYNLDDNYIDKQQKILSKTTKEIINKTAAAHLNDDKMIITIVGDKNVVFEPLKKLGYEIIELTPDGNTMDFNFKK